MKEVRKVVISAVLFCMACSGKYSPEIESTLKQAGENRIELEQMLNRELYL